MAHGVLLDTRVCHQGRLITVPTGMFDATATVTAVEDDKWLVISTDQAGRLKPGMWVYGQAPDASGSWKILGVGSSSARALPNDSSWQAKVGAKVSTRRATPKQQQ